MQRDLSKQRRSDEEAVKAAGLVLDFDEIARKGSMSREEIAVAKWYGIYHSRQPGNHMARVVIPGGQITSVAGPGVGPALGQVCARANLVHHAAKRPTPLPEADGTWRPSCASCERRG